MGRAVLAAALAGLAFASGCSGGGSGDRAETLPSVATATEPTGTQGGEERAELSSRRPRRGWGLRLEQVAAGLEAPVHAAAAPGDSRHLYLVEQPGRIRVVVLSSGRVARRPFLDVADEVASGGERGLLALAFHPAYAENGLFYVNYTNRAGDTRVVEYRAGAGSEPTRERVLLAVRQPYANHNGGQLAFGPDGRLYVGMGDGGSSGDPEDRAQDLSSRLGKLLRRDVDERGAAWETVAYGLRNPWRFSFDRLTGDLWIGDVGQGAIEEIDFVPADRVGELLNFGWDVLEGSRRHEDKRPTKAGRLVGPVSEYTHELGCSVTGGFVYRGADVRGRAWGRYFFGDYCSGRIWSLARSRSEITVRGHPFRVPRLTSFAEDADGELYLVSQAGTVHRLAAE